MADDLLARLHRTSRSVAHLLGPFRPFARGAFRYLLKRRYDNTAVMQVTQNGRTWRLAPEVALRGEFEEFETILWLRQVVEPGMQVIDIGANVGQMTLEAARLAGAKGRVLAIEPAPGNLQLLRKHLEANGLEKVVEIVSGACAERNGVMTLFVAGSTENDVGSGHTLVGKRALEAQKAPNVTQTPVQTFTVDELCRVRSFVPAVVKIDVEGGELGVLRGMSQTLRVARPKVRIGFHPFAFEDPEAASEELRVLLSDADYILEAPIEGCLDLQEYNAVPRQ